MNGINKQVAVSCYALQFLETTWKKEFQFDYRINDHLTTLFCDVGLHAFNLGQFKKKTIWSYHVQSRELSIVPQQ